MEMVNNFLEAAYRDLDFSSGDLLNTKSSYQDLSIEQWVEKQEWLSLGDRAGAEKLFFVQGNPVIVFATSSNADEDILRDIYNRIWCMARPRYLFLAKPGDLSVYDLTDPPAKTNQDWLEKTPLAVANSISEVIVSLKKYSRDKLESGFLLENNEGKKLTSRADKSLIENLRILRAKLIEYDLRPKYAHALIARSIFIRYLEDRGIIDKEYFKKIADEYNIDWQYIENQWADDENLEQAAKQWYIRILSDKHLSYFFFERLSQDFNGDIFPSERDEALQVTQNHLQLLQSFLKGDIGESEKQTSLFFWAYRFDIIPLSLISSIYEEFYHEEDNTRNHHYGTHYTPGSLVEFSISKVLTPEILATKPRVLDPCCGSGIFLVEAFKRLVRYHLYINSGNLDYADLCNILKNQIAGIEINPEATKVTAFSLYLAFLNYQHPPAIIEKIKQGQKLPKVICKDKTNKDERNLNILLNANAFDIEVTAFFDTDIHRNFGKNCADVVVGNPPWGAPSSTDSQLQLAKKWCNENNFPIGDNEHSQTFIWRTYDFLRESGVSALLVSTGVFLKTHDKSKAFREKWLGSVFLREVYNFAPVRHVFFSGKGSQKKKSAIAPFALVIFENNQLSHAAKKTIYWSATRTKWTEDSQIVVLDISDRRLVSQRKLSENYTIWKTYMWGNHRDEALISSICAQDRLSSILDTEKSGQGFSTGQGNPFDADWLANYKKLPTKLFKSYGKVKDEWLEDAPSKVWRLAKEDFYNGKRLLVKHGIQQKGKKKGALLSRYETKSFCFTNSINCLKIKDGSSSDYKILLGILWSSLTRYYFFMTSSKWGIWHDGIYNYELKGLPIAHTTNKILIAKITQIVDSLQNSSERYSSKIKALEKELDEAIFELYELSPSDQDLIVDACNTTIDFFYNPLNGDASQPISKSYLSKDKGTILDLVNPHIERLNYPTLEDYLYILTSLWNKELNPEAEIEWQILSDQDNPMVAVLLSIRDFDKKNEENSSSRLVGWDELLEKLSQTQDGFLHNYDSRQIYVDGMIRVVSESEIVIVKKNIARLWTRSSAYEDYDATYLKAIQMQNIYDSLS
ncbi:MAG: N-6 DNA methylase [Leptolyngbya sp. SIO1D8]|nr:N-6 DNA methylase [Leptolyngbya sp. SIO1D8]